MKKVYISIILLLSLQACGNGLGELLIDEKKASSTEELYPPSNLTSSMCLYDNEIHLSWNKVNNAIFYEIHRSTDRINFTKIATSTSNSYIDTTSTSSLFFYKIKAISSQTQSSLSDIANGMIKKTVISLTYNFSSFIDGSSATAGTGDSDFNDPSGVIVDSSHNIYISDTGNHRIKKYNSAGTLIGWWGRDDLGTSSFHALASGRTSQSGNSEFAFNYPQKLFIDNNILYIADTNNHRIQKIYSDHTNTNYINWWGKATTTGWNTGEGSEQGSQLGELFFPFGMAFLSSTNNFFILDTFNHRVQKIDASNNVISFFKFGYSSETILYPHDIKIKDNKMYIIDSYSVKVFDLSGNYLYSFGKMGSGVSEFFMAEGIEIDEDNNIIVADAGNHRIQVFSNEGCYINTFGSLGTADGKFYYPRDVAYDNNSGTKSLIITDSQNNRVQKWVQP